MQSSVIWTFLIIEMALLQVFYMNSRLTQNFEKLILIQRYRNIITTYTNILKCSRDWKVLQTLFIKHMRPTCWRWWALLGVAVPEQTARPRVEVVFCVHLFDELLRVAVLGCVGLERAMRNNFNCEIVIGAESLLLSLCWRVFGIALYVARWASFYLIGSAIVNLTAKSFKSLRKFISIPAYEFEFANYLVALNIPDRPYSVLMLQKPFFVKATEILLPIWTTSYCSTNAFQASHFFRVSRSLRRDLHWKKSLL